MNRKKILEDLSIMQQIYAILFSTANKIQASSDSTMNDITSRQFMALLAIAHLNPMDTSLKNIAKKLGTSKQTANKLVNSLKVKNLIEIHNNEIDKRVLNLTITIKGQKILVDSSKKNIMFLGEVFKDFSTEELNLLWNLLKKVHKFDGQEYTGYEENANNIIDSQIITKEEVKFEEIIQEFTKLRTTKEIYLEKNSK